MKMLRYILLSSIMLLCGTLSYAQKSGAPAKSEEPKADYSFKSIAVSADIFGLASSLLNDCTSSQKTQEGLLQTSRCPIPADGRTQLDRFAKVVQRMLLILPMPKPLLKPILFYSYIPPWVLFEIYVYSFTVFPLLQSKLKNKHQMASSNLLLQRAKQHRPLVHLARSFS